MILTESAINRSAWRPGSVPVVAILLDVPGERVERVAGAFGLRMIEGV